MKIDKEAFSREVYEVLTAIPLGSVISYGEIAELLGKPTYSRMVGRALRIVPQGLGLPCHRVVNAQGRLAPGWEEQRQLLFNEGVIFRRNGTVDMDRCRWRWKEI